MRILRIRIPNTDSKIRKEKICTSHCSRTAATWASSKSSQLGGGRLSTEKLMALMMVMSRWLASGESSLLWLFCWRLGWAIVRDSWENVVSLYSPEGRGRNIY
jgi:hypothetical protein